MMKTEVLSYVNKKLASDFEKCQWEDGVGKKFEANNLAEMRKSVGALEDTLAEAFKFFRETENLLSSIKEE